MFKLLKHEVKGMYLNFSIMIVGLIILNLILNEGAQYADGMKDIILWMGLTVFLNIGAVFMIAIDGFRMLTRDIYSETGYSVFMLPLRAYSILLSKIIFTISEMTILLAVIKLISCIIFKAPVGSLSQNLSILMVVLAIYIAMVVIVYFAQVAGKIITNIIGLSRLITLVLIFGITYGGVYINQYLSEIFPNTILLTTFAKLYHSSGFKIEINNAALIFEIFVVIVLFVSTSYFIEKKMDV